jgi:hypothetical protein
VLPRLVHPKDLVVGDDRRQRHDPACECLPEDEHVRSNAVVLACERRPGAPEPGLDLVGHEQYVRSVQSSRARRT